MRRLSLNNFIKGWFIGNFEPTIVKTNEVEVAVKRYRAGDQEIAHHHKIATEITVIVSGQVLMNGVLYGPDDVLVIEPNESTDFECLTDVITTVVKYPGASNDKYID